MVPSARKAALRMGLTECIARAASPQGCLPRLRRGDPRGMAGGTPANPARLVLSGSAANVAVNPKQADQKQRPGEHDDGGAQHQLNVDRSPVRLAKPVDSWREARDCKGQAGPRGQRLCRRLLIDQGGDSHRSGLTSEARRPVASHRYETSQRSSVPTLGPSCVPLPTR